MNGRRPTPIFATNFVSEERDFEVNIDAVRTGCSVFANECESGVHSPV
jgi:hypothetical protein